MLAGRCPGRYRCAADRAICKVNICFYGRIPARIQNLSSEYFRNFHSFLSLAEVHGRSKPGAWTAPLPTNTDAIEARRAEVKLPVVSRSSTGRAGRAGKTVPHV